MHASAPPLHHCAHGCTRVCVRACVPYPLALACAPPRPQLLCLSDLEQDFINPYDLSKKLNGFVVGGAQGAARLVPGSQHREGPARPGAPQSHTLTRTPRSQPLQKLEYGVQLLLTSVLVLGGRWVIGLMHVGLSAYMVSEHNKHTPPGLLCTQLAAVVAGLSRTALTNRQRLANSKPPLNCPTPARRCGCICRGWCTLTRLTFLSNSSASSAGAPSCLGRMQFPWSS